MILEPVTIRRFLTSRQTSSKQAWAVINSLIKGNKNANPYLAGPIIHKDCAYSDNRGMANAFNDFFTTIGEELSGNLNSQTSPSQFLRSPSTSTMFSLPSDYRRAPKTHR